MNSAQLSDQLRRHVTIRPIRQPNRVKLITKAEDGGLWVHQHSGRTFKIDKDDELFQVFVVYTVLAGERTPAETKLSMEGELALAAVDGEDTP
jgi:hypothetical protein